MASQKTEPETGWDSKLASKMQIQQVAWHTVLMLTPEAPMQVTWRRVLMQIQEAPTQTLVVM